MARNNLIEIIGTDEDDVLEGTSTSEGTGFGHDFISGLGGNDRILGRSGDDDLDGGPGNDELDGGPGIDTANYLSSLGRVDVDLKRGTVKESGAGNTQEDPQVTEDRLINIENILGSNFDDSLAGNAGVNEISGSDGNDRLFGRDGDDTLRGGASEDVLRGAEGNDDLSGGDGNDMLRRRSRLALRRARR